MKSSNPLYETSPRMGDVLPACYRFRHWQRPLVVAILALVPLCLALGLAYQLTVLLTFSSHYRFGKCQQSNCTATVIKDYLQVEAVLSPLPYPDISKATVLRLDQPNATFCLPTIVSCYYHRQRPADYCAYQPPSRQGIERTAWALTASLGIVLGIFCAASLLIAVRTC